MSAEGATRIEDWTRRFTGTRALPRTVRDRLIRAARIMRIAKGAQVFGPDNVPDRLFFLYEGRKSVSQTSDGGRGR